MSTTPLVSIIVPVSYGDEEIDRALQSCISQTLNGIEIVCIERSSGTPAVRQTVTADPRVQLITQPAASVSEARRAGVAAATAPYVLFIDPGDEVDSSAAAIAYQKATDSGADIVEFGVDVLRPAGHRATVPLPGARRKNGGLRGDNILRQLFPDGRAVDTDIWRYLFRTALLRDVYANLPDGLTAISTDDVPIVFLACAAAKSYAYVPTALYRRAAGNEILHPATDAVSAFRAAVVAIDSASAIEPIVRRWARHSPNPEPLVDGYDTLRLARIANALKLLQRVPADMYQQEFEWLQTRVSDLDAVASAAIFAPSALQTMAQRGDRLELGSSTVRSVLLTTNVLTTGGVSGVLLTQARMLLDAGYRVTIATHRPGSDKSLVPDGASHVEVSGTTKRYRLAHWAEICRRNEVDVVIDHRILYSRDWPGYALTARACRVPTVGWIHNFAGRPTYNANNLHSLIQDHANALAQLIVLSALDVAFWKLRGVRHVAYLPNPPSPLLLESAGRVSPRTSPVGPRVEIVWWGRLEEHTKRVTQLVEVAAALKRSGMDFRLRIVGPDWTDMTALRLSAFAAKRGLEGLVDVTGPRHGQDLLDVIDSSDIFINTSIIEGYLLTIPEAQSRGLPVLMYDLPWLVPVQDNPGVIAVPQGDANALADAISALAADPERYADLSRASVEAAGRAISYDFAQLYQQLVAGTMPTEFSPEPTLEDGQKILNLLVFFAEKSAASNSTRVKRRRASPNGGSRRRPQPQTLGAKIERKLTPMGHRVLEVTPWIRPVARRVKQALLRR